MICLKSHLSKVLIIFLFSFISIPYLVAGERDDLYIEGLAAYSNNEHVEALKKLYAFYVINEAEILNNPEFMNKLKEKITTSETVLKVAFSSNPSIIKSDNRIRIITKQGGGSFIGTGMEVEDLLDKKAIDLKVIESINHKSLTIPSS
ncbi:hypothetical protein [Marinobacterium lacunae]|uniref:hypothetical protein n=1 Tax=Marinobacterium lacunae TaxID=1232683 RepID=UPI00056259E4|nr:hypothetical protein [Marinobacterium lacunae]